MKQQDIHKLPFWETVSRSLKYVLKNKHLLKGLSLVVAILTFIQIILGLPYLCSISFKNCTYDWRQIVTMISILIASVGVIINYCRVIVCKASVEFKSFKFWKQVGLYIVSLISVSIIILLPTFISIMGSVFIFNMAKLDNLVTATSILFPFVFSILLAPLFIIFPAIAVEDYSLIKWKKLFSLTKGNCNAIFWSQFILMMPYWLLFRALMATYHIINIDSYIVNLIFVIIGVSIGMIDACLKGAFFAHIYQFFKFYEKD